MFSRVGALRYFLDPPADIGKYPRIIYLLGLQMSTNIILGTQDPGRLRCSIYAVPVLEYTCETTTTSR